MIDLINGKDDGLAEFFHRVPDQFRAHLHPVLGVDQHDAGVGHPQSGDNLAHEIVQPGGVDDVDLVIPPFGMQRGGVHRVAALVFDGVIIGDGVLVFYRAASLGEPCLKNHGLGQGCLAGLDTAQQNDVLDVLIVVDFHAAPPLLVNMVRGR